MKKRHAIAVALLLTLGAYVLVAVLVERPFLDTRVPPGREHRAALAIRDDVTPFQQWGSRTFTRHYLDRYYGASWYFTQAKRGHHKKAFIAALEEALERHEQVDLYLLSHSNRYISWVAQLPLERRERLHLVYNTGCHNLHQGPQWLGLGADAYVGHPGNSMSSVFYVFFLRRWSRGDTVQEAMDASNRLALWSFRLWEAIPRWDFNAAHAFLNSEASRYGKGDVRIVGVV